MTEPTPELPEDEDCLDFPEGEDPTGLIEIPLEEPEAAS